MDPRIVEHAKILVNYSTSVKRGDNVLVETTEQGGQELAVEICREAANRGAQPIILSLPTDYTRAVLEATPIEDLATMPNNLLEAVKASDVDIFVLSWANTRFLETIDPQRIAVRNKALQPYYEEYLKKRWTVTLHPTNAHAQEAGMSLREYQDFVYSSILHDWAGERARMRPLEERMNKADEVHLIGSDTDLSFSVKGRTAIVDDGKKNLPGGEVFTAPVDDTAEGTISFDLPSIYAGKEVTDIRLTFEKGRILDYSARKNESLLKKLIETDDGSHRLGEFGVGMNRGINRSTRNILFDEKIAGTIHLAIGRAYKDCGGVNESAIHWDMIKTMKPGQITLDREPIQVDGKLVWE